MIAETHISSNQKKGIPEQPRVRRKKKGYDCLLLAESGLSRTVVLDHHELFDLSPLLGQKRSIPNQ
jgi:hypothetical protein